MSIFENLNHQYLLFKDVLEKSHRQINSPGSPLFNALKIIKNGSVDRFIEINLVDVHFSLFLPRVFLSIVFYDVKKSSAFFPRCFCKKKSTQNFLATTLPLILTYSYYTNFPRNSSASDSYYTNVFSQLCTCFLLHKLRLATALHLIRTTQTFFRNSSAPDSCYTKCF